jgi:hypothetical protein
VSLLTEPAAGNGYQSAHALLLLENFHRLTGRDLLPAGPSPEALARALYEAPFVLLSHDTAEDPLFTYANLTAQKLFAMPWTEIVGLPSRFSAEPLAREERQRLLEQVARQGYISDYRGVRIARDGRRFYIEHATVWNLTDAIGAPAGQAATFDEWQAI